jgi:hypothetical protein
MESEAMWEGRVEVEGVQAQGVFEVFNSGGGWEFLFGKPLQMTFAAVHDYKRDKVDIEARGKRATLTNQRGGPWWKNFKPPGANGTHAAFTGAVSFADAPVRRVHSTKIMNSGNFDKQRTLETIQEDSEGEEREEAEDEKGERLPQRRQVTVEEVEDRENAPSPLRMEIYVRPEDAWPYAGTNSRGLARPPRGEYLNICCQHGRI